jgi:ESCRT-I complex subunit VPS37
MDPETMLNILKSSAAESEENSEKISDDFLSRSLTTDEFLEQFKSSRTEMHLRKLKVDKMQELLRQGGGSGQQHPPQINYPPGMSNFYGPSHHGGPAPYPSMQGGYPMPMPPNFRSPF